MFPEIYCIWHDLIAVTRHLMNQVPAYCAGRWTSRSSFPESKVNGANMGLFLSITFLHIWGCMCWTGPFEFRWLKEYIHNPSYYHHQIGSIHLSYCCHIFPWLCVWDGCTIIFCHLLHIYPGKLGLCFHFWCSVYGICKRRIHNGL